MAVRPWLAPKRLEKSQPLRVVSEQAVKIIARVVLVVVPKVSAISRVSGSTVGPIEGCRLEY